MTSNWTWALCALCVSVFQSQPAVAQQAVRDSTFVVLLGTGNPYPDPNESDEKLVVIDLKPKKKLPSPVTLSDIKADPAFQGWDLLRIGRLSVVPVPDPMWTRVVDLAESAD